MPGKGENGFNQVVHILRNIHYDDLANDLLAQRQKLVFGKQLILEKYKMENYRYVLESLAEDFAEELNVGQILPYLKETKHFSARDMKQISVLYIITSLLLFTFSFRYKIYTRLLYCFNGKFICQFFS